MLIKIQVFFLLTSTFLLCHCTTAVIPSEVTTSALARQSEKNNVVNPYSEPTSSYLSLAKAQEGIEQQRSLLRAAGHLISEGKWRQGAAILAQASDLTPILADEKNLLLAQIDMSRGHSQMALNKLATITEQKGMPLYQQIQYHACLAKAYAVTNRLIDSVKERIKLELLITDSRRQANNRRALWLALRHVSPSELATLALKTPDDSILQGWIQLALISNNYRNHSVSLIAALEQWRSHFGNHPANRFLPSPLHSIAYKIHDGPKKVALLLPLSGALQEPGIAVRDGFIAAYQSSPNGMAIHVNTYDTNNNDVVLLYQKAIEDGADYIVGPLTKPQAAAVAVLPHPVPTLLLNDSDNPIAENAYSFGLSPVSEAVQVAIRAKNKGYSHALIIAPNNAWGHEIKKAFSRQWQKGGGRVVDTFLYGSHDDLNKSMRNFLQIDDSQLREKRIKELLGQTIQSVISRRQDFDMVFLLAYPSKARQIMPLLNYYYAGDIPVYATANVYGGSANPLKDKDLDGVIFCDIPWVFAHQVGSRNWPEQFNSYNRLYALGTESYTLATQLNQLILFPADEAQIGSGILYLKPSQQVARVLEWGQFKDGLVHSLGEVV